LDHFFQIGGGRFLSLESQWKEKQDEKNKKSV